MTRRLIAVDMAPGSGFVRRLIGAWNDGDAILPVDQRLPLKAKQQLYQRLQPHIVATDTGDQPQKRAAPEVGPDDAAVVATSGTTGDPKGVVLTHQAIAASAMSSDSRLGTTSSDHWLACLPLAHIGGLSVIFRALHTGTGLTVLPRFDAHAVEDAARRGATMVSLVPTTLGRVDPGLFETILIGGARPPASRPANSVTTYGMTETGSGVVYDGKALDGVELTIDDGEIRVRGPMLLRCYRGVDPTDPDTIEHSPFDASGWFHTGDMGTLHPDGTLSVSGRRGDLIITGGENVWPTPVEESILQLADVADVIVAGAADPEWGQVVVAHVVSASGRPPSVEAIRDQVKSQLPAYCAPRRVVVHQHLPRTALGKPQRHLL